jgi:CDP-diacylglycerol---glycerol-3-phosphate 3-phosphatidyltransferase
MNFANLITSLRMILIPFIAYYIYQDTKLSLIWAIVLFTIAVITSVIDGIVARIRNEETKFGSFIDPFADKILIVTLLFVFVTSWKFSIYLFLFFILRDVVMLIFRWLASHDDIDIKEEVYWNICLYLQMAIVFGLIVESLLIKMQLKEYFTFVEVFIGLAVFVTMIFIILSIIHHSLAYVKGVRNRIKLGKEIKKENIAIIANRKSRGYYDGYRRRLLKVFAKRRNAPVFFFHKNRKEMFDKTEQKVHKNKEIIVAGGDGSFEGALNYKSFNKKSLGFFPLGAGNAFYSYFYKGKRFEYLRSRFPFRESELDVLEVEWEKGKKQTLFMSIGIDAEVMRLSSKKRTQHGFFDYVSASFKAFFKSKADMDLICELDNKTRILNNCVNFTFGKVPYLGYGIRALVGNINPNDGLIYGNACINSHNIMLNKPVRLWGLLLGMFNLNKSPLFKFKGEKIFLKSEIPFPLQAGGDFLGYTHWIKIKIKRKQSVLII